MLRIFQLFLLCFLSSLSRQIHSPFNHYIHTENLTRYASLRQAESLSKSHSESLLQPLLIPRVSGSKGNAKVAKFIQDFFAKLNWNVQLDSFNDQTPLGIKSFTNIIATQNPKALRKLVFACHYDSKYMKDFEFIGASDSAVPCSILMDMAQSLNPHISPSHVTMQLIFFDGEEAFEKWTDTDSLYGSRHLASKWETEMVPIVEKQELPEGMVSVDGMNTLDNPLYNNVLSTIDLFILLDLLGTNDHVQMFNYFYDSFISNLAFERLVDIEQRLSTVNLVSSAWQERVSKNQGHFHQGYHSSQYNRIQDDHIPFHRRGVPILHCIPLPFPRVWHKKGDDASAIDEDVVKDLSLIYTVFAAEYLGIKV